MTALQKRFTAAMGFALVSCAVLMLPHRAMGKPKPAKPAEEEKPPVVAAILPADLNVASLRVTALDMMYQFDFSPEQIKALLAESQGSADSQARAAAAPNEKLAEALNALAQAILDSKDDAQITRLRNAVIQLASEDNTQPLNDEVHTTAHALAATPKVFALISTTQIASYIAGHANEVGDPREILNSAMLQLRGNRADEPDGKNAQSTADAVIQETATDVGFLLGGLDDSKAKAIAGQVSELLKSVYAMKDDAFKAQRPALEESINKMTADVPAMQVLANWLQRQVAVLLSNPQLPEAIGARQKADSAKPAAQ